MDNQEKDSSFTNSVIKTLSEPWTEVGIELLEQNIDELFDNDVLKLIPFVKTGLSICEAGIHIRDKMLLKKTLYFITTLNDGTISEKNYKSYQNKIVNNPKEIKREIDHILYILDLSRNENQSIRLAKFYQSYVKQAINWDKFCELAEANMRIFESDFELLKRIEKKEDLVSNYQSFRLSAVGLIEIGPKGFSNGNLNMTNICKLSSFGKTFLQNCR